MALLSTAYMGNSLYYGTILNSGKCIIELNENYSKQTYRNRCTILSANGSINLTIPIVKISGEKIPIKSVKIDYATPWQKLHTRSIVSAYKNSPYFDHYVDDFFHIFGKRYDYLVDLNYDLHLLIMKILKTDIKTQFTESFSEYADEDYRYSISPKILVDGQQFKPYYQVFSEKLPFEPNLSIIDMIFCVGPEIKDYLIKTI